MNISIFGLGYVGAVTAGCLAELGHCIVGADVQQAKVDAFNSGESPVIEPELDNLLGRARRENRLRATADAAEAVGASEVSIVCVGTPSLESGRLNLGFVRKVSAQIADGIARKKGPHVVMFRSTMLPGSTRALAREFFERPDLRGRVALYFCPEFLREGTAVKDFREPSLAVIGTADGSPPAGDEARRLLGGSPAVLGWEGAEMIKYACNCFHAVKIGFANEIGRVCKHLGEDGARVLDVLCADTKLNISRQYLRPGNPFGGSCLPKDLGALRAFARSNDLSVPLLESAIESNRAHLDALVQMITGKDRRRVGLLGLAFKPDTDDLRNSPMVAVAETLLGRGYEVHVYDPQLNLARLIGANASEIQRRMPHLAQLLRSSPREVIEASEIVVAAQRCARADEIALAARPDQVVIDVNGWDELRAGAWAYEGFCW